MNPTTPRYSGFRPFSFFWFLLFLFIQNFFPGLIAVVYVLRPSGLLQKAISEVSNKFFREDFKFKVRAPVIPLLPYFPCCAPCFTPSVFASQVVICSCLDELHQRIDASQLTTELGGCLFYNHIEWIDTRVVSSFAGGPFRRT